MNRLDILAAEPGEELDIAVAEFLGCEVVMQAFSLTDELGIMRFEKESGKHVFEGNLPEYSSSWSDVKAVIEHMNDNDYNLELIVGADGNSMATFMLVSGDKILKHDAMVCDTPQEAICKAALITKAQV